ncbi:MAG: O-antigen ligase family protein [Clostridia bacterium]|nr:O-antigen ligase family protein [Deltaproteobacteria bacterium]
MRHSAKPDFEHRVRSAIRIAFGLVLVLTPLALGGTPPEVIVAVSSVLVICATAALFVRHNGRAIFDSSFLLAFGAAVVVTAVQLVPVPLGILRWLSPGAYDVLTLHASPSWHAFSLDPPATSLALVGYIGIFAAAIVGMTVYRKRTKELLALVVIAVIVSVLGGFVHLALGWEISFGRYGVVNTDFVTAFLNPNHFAGLCGFGAFAALSLAMELKDERRWLPLGGAGICAAAVTLSFSRGAVMALIAACTFLGLLLVRGEARQRKLWLLLVPVGIACIMFFALARSSILREMATLTGSRDARITIWAQALRALPHFWAFGVGSGAFGFAFARFQPSMDVTFTHTENQFLQCVMDWGVLPGLLVLTIAIAGFVRCLRSRNVTNSGTTLVAGFFFVGIHNFIDFDFALMGVALPVVACAAALEAHVLQARVGRHESAKRKGTIHWARYAGFAVIAVTVLVGLSAFALGNTSANGVQHLRDLCNGSSDRTTRAAALDRYIVHHPADFLSRLIVANRELDDRDGAPTALRLINEAMFLAPNYAVVHRLAGRALVQVGAEVQALSEYRMALDARYQLTNAITDEVYALSPRLVRGLVADDPERRLRIATHMLQFAKPDEIEPLLDLPGLAQDPRAIEIFARTALTAQRWDDVIHHAKTLQSMQPGAPWPYEAEASAQRGRGELTLALGTLNRGVETTAGAAPILAMLASTLADMGDFSHATEVANRLITRTSTTQAAADAHALLASIFERQGRTSAAILEVERARERAPKNPSLYLKLAELHRREGNISLARHELERGLVSTGGSAELRRALAALK